MPLNDSFWKIAGVLALILIVMGIVGNGDVEEAERQQEHYCSMVAAGNWPDYNGNYKELCHQPQK